MAISVAILVEDDVDSALGHANTNYQKDAIVYINQVLLIFDHKNTPNDCINKKHTVQNWIKNQ